MKINDILLESYGDAKRIFSQDEEQETVTKYLDTFKDLTKRNVVKGQDKDIGKWIKSGWDDFKAFVDSKKETQTNSQAKKAKKKDSIVVYEDDEKMVVIPLSTDASCFYGKSTKWCTASTESKNHFYDYFVIRGIALFYVLFSGGEKYAAAYNQAMDKFEFFDVQDKSMTAAAFQEATGIEPKQLKAWESEYESVMMKARQSQGIRNQSPEKQLELLEEHPMLIRFLENPTEEMKLVAVRNNGLAIMHVDNPSEALQIAAVQHDGNMLNRLNDIAKPSEKVKLAAVQQNGDAIEYVVQPSVEIQVAAVKQSSTALMSIGNPSEEAKKAHKETWTNSDAIYTDAFSASEHAINVVKGPFPEGEQAMIEAPFTKSAHAIRYIEFLRANGFAEEAKDFGQRYAKHQGFA